MRPNICKSVAVIILVSLTLLPIGCTKEKAEAVKTAAEHFRVQADKALEATSSLVKESVNTLPQEKEAELKALVRQLENQPTEQLQGTISGVMDRYKVTRAANRSIDAEFGNMMNEYAVFASMFDNLPRGHLFAKDAVASAERHAIRLTLRFVKMASEIDHRPVTFEARRNQLVVDLMAARLIPDQRDRSQAIQIVAQKAIDLRAAEAKANEDAILQCLRAAEAGKSSAELIRNYSKMSVADIVAAVSESLGVINDITGGANAKLKTLIGKYNSFVDSKVKTDPLWKSVWDTDVNL